MAHDDRQRHDSYAIAQFNKRHHSMPDTLFGSSVKHSHTIVLSITPASVSRDLNTDWYSPERIPYLEVEMSFGQFAELVSNHNSGVGTPVTLRRLDGKRIDPCPYESKREVFDNEIEKTFRELASSINGMTETVSKILEKKGALTVTEKASIMDAITSAQRHLADQLPFAKRMFSEQMDKTVADAKGEFEGYVQHVKDAILAKMMALQMDTPEKELLDHPEFKDAGPNDEE